MASKVRVYGKAQNRTVLGIANAYLVMYPHATLEDLNKAFPIELNSSNRSDKIFIDVKDAGNFKTAKEGNSTYELFFFEKPDELLTLQNGQKVAMLELWTKSDFDKFVNHAKQYDIEVADFKPKEGFKKGGFTLEYLNGYIPPAPGKKSKWWIWVVLAVIIAAVILILLFLNRKTEPEIVEVERVVERVVHVVDTVYVNEIEEIENNFNAARFEQGKSDLTDDAKFVLHDLSKLLESNPQIKLKIIGHTSDEGEPDYNQRLSEYRAKAAVDFLISRGIGEDRLQFEGKGSSQPIDPTNREINRRTEFEIIE